MTENVIPYQVKLTQHSMQAFLVMPDDVSISDIIMTDDMIESMLGKHHIVHGIDWEALQTLKSNVNSIEFPLTIARGTEPADGIDGDISYQANLKTGVLENKHHFRDVMRIPSARKGEKLATLIAPKPGQDGKNVCGDPVPAKSGKPYHMKAGKNVVFRPADCSFYAVDEGQISIKKRLIDVHSVYNVHEELSMKTGNIEFVGTVIIHGNVPSGYTIHAEGDIKVFGMVEAAQIKAGGSVYISEGFSGQQTGSITAEVNVHTGYINQGYVNAGQHIFADKSILHSHVTAGRNIDCHAGTIIGGQVSAGTQIEVKDLGNRMNSRTDTYLGAEQALLEKLNQLTTQQQELTLTLNKLFTLGRKLTSSRKDGPESDKIKLMKLKQQNAYEQTQTRLNTINAELEEINAMYHSGAEASLTVFGMIYHNVTIHFGKYAKTIVHDRKAVKICLEENDIQLHSLDAD